MNFQKLILKILSPYHVSTHKAIYDKLAQEFEIPPKTVYKLAHGKRPSSFTEEQVVEELINIGILRFK